MLYADMNYMDYSSKEEKMGLGRFIVISLILIASTVDSFKIEVDSITVESAASTFIPKDIPFLQILGCGIVWLEPLFLEEFPSSFRSLDVVSFRSGSIINNMDLTFLSTSPDDAQVKSVLIKAAPTVNDFDIEADSITVESAEEFPSSFRSLDVVSFRSGSIINNMDLTFLSTSPDDAQVKSVLIKAAPTVNDFDIEADSITVESAEEFPSSFRSLDVVSFRSGSIINNMDLTFLSTSPDDAQVKSVLIKAAPTVNDFDIEADSITVESAEEFPSSFRSLDVISFRSGSIINNMDLTFLSTSPDDAQIKTVLIKAAPTVNGFDIEADSITVESAEEFPSSFRSLDVISFRSGSIINNMDLTFLSTSPDDAQIKTVLIKAAPTVNGFDIEADSITVESAEEFPSSFRSLDVVSFRSGSIINNMDLTFLSTSPDDAQIKSVLIKAAPTVNGFDIEADSITVESAAFRQRASMIKGQLEPLYKRTFPSSFRSLNMVSFRNGSVINNMDLRFTGIFPNNTQIANVLINAASDVTGFDIETSSISVDGAFSSGVRHKISIVTASCLAVLSWLLSSQQ
ncbi:hypothetical protein PAMP_015692 [Pampus punctatissimus]